MPTMHQNTFGGQVLPGPAGGAYSAPQTPGWILGGLLLREGRKEEGRKGKGR